MTVCPRHIIIDREAKSDKTTDNKAEAKAEKKSAPKPEVKAAPQPKENKEKPD